MPFADLRKALQNHDFDRAQAIQAEEGLDLDAPEALRTLLWWMTDAGNVKGARWLLERGVDVNKLSGSLKEPALTVAVRQGHLDLLELFAAHGADVNAPDPDGMTPLMRALQHPTRPRLLVERLLALGADPNRVTARDGSSALMIALTEDRVEVLQALADAHANPELANRDGRLPIHVAVKGHRLDVIEEFLAVFPKVDLDRPMKNGMIALSQSKATNVTTLLLRAGANPAVRSTNPFDEGRTPLMGLLANPSANVALELALRQGAPVADADFNGQTNLGYAIEAENIVGMEQLYLHGLPVDSPASRLGLSPYHLWLSAMKAADAPMPSNPKAAEAFLKRQQEIQGLAADLAAMLDRHGVPVDLPVSPGVAKGLPRYSPLAEALSDERTLPYAASLIALGADINHRGPNGRAPIHALVALDAKLSPALRQAAGVVKHVQQMREEVRETPLTDKELAHLDAQLEGARITREDALRAVAQGFGTLVAAGDLDPSVVEGRGWTALEMAAREDAAQVAVRLIHHGHDATQGLDDRLDPITVALHQGKTLTLTAMIEATAAVGRPWTPSLDALVLATPETYPERGRFLAALQDLAAQPQWATWRDQVDEDGNSALILAAATGQGDLVETLLHLGGASLVNHTNALGETALVHALGQKDALAAEALLSCGARQDLVPASGVVLAHLAAGDRILGSILAGDVRPLRPMTPREGLATDLVVARELATHTKVAPQPPLQGIPGAFGEPQADEPSKAQQLAQASAAQLGLGQRMVSRRERAQAQPAPVEPGVVEAPVRPTRRRSP